jgi:hypothetical protein
VQLVPDTRPRFLGGVREMDGSPKFSVISLPTCHALETPPESPGACLRSLSVLNSDLIHLNAPLLLASIATRMSPSGWLTYEAESLKGGASPLRPMGCAVYASVVSFIRFLLSFTPARLATNRVASPYPSRLSPFRHFRRGLSPRKRYQASLGAQ